MAPEILYTSEQLTGKFECKRAVETPGNPKFSDEFLKIHRAIRWLGRAEKESDDPDAAFIFQWIAFNAAYARDMPGKWVKETKAFQTFIKRVVCVDKKTSSKTT